MVFDGPADDVKCRPCPVRLADDVNVIEIGGQDFVRQELGSSNFEGMVLSKRVQRGG
jgi:hypothetical protein